MLNDSFLHVLSSSVLNMLFYYFDPVLLYELESINMFSLLSKTFLNLLLFKTSLNWILKLSGKGKVSISAFK